jgi:hypothetical protein
MAYLVLCLFEALYAILKKIRIRLETLILSAASRRE